MLSDHDEISAMRDQLRHEVRCRLQWVRLVERPY
jgi:hypothetical protein